MKAASRPLLVGLDNPHSNDPRMALYPTPNTTGARLVDLIGETVHNYSRQEYLRDFSRTNLYPTKRAVIGAGSVRADREAFSHVEHLVQMLDVSASARSARTRRDQTPPAVSYPAASPEGPCRPLW